MVKGTPQFVRHRPRRNPIKESAPRADAPAGPFDMQRGGTRRCYRRSVEGGRPACNPLHRGIDLHDVRLIPAQYVKPFLKGHKNDYRDAEAIAEAVQRPTMHFVAIKTPEQMDLLALHRVRSRLVARNVRIVAGSGRAQEPKRNSGVMACWF